MNIKPKPRRLVKTVTTWLTIADYEKFEVIANQDHVSVAALLRGLVIDAIAEDLPARPGVNGDCVAEKR